MSSRSRTSTQGSDDQGELLYKAVAAPARKALRRASSTIRQTGDIAIKIKNFGDRIISDAATLREDGDESAASPGLRRRTSLAVNRGRSGSASSASKSIAIRPPSVPRQDTPAFTRQRSGRRLSGRASASAAVSMRSVAAAASPRPRSQTDVGGNGLASPWSTGRSSVMGFLPTHRGRRSTPQRSSATPSHPERQRRGEGKEEWERRTKPYNSELDIGLPLRNRRLELFRAAALANDEDTVISLVALDPALAGYLICPRMEDLPRKLHGSPSQAVAHQLNATTVTDNAMPPPHSRASSTDKPHSRSSSADNTGTPRSPSPALQDMLMPLENGLPRMYPVVHAAIGRASGGGGLRGSSSGGAFALGRDSSLSSSHRGSVDASRIGSESKTWTRLRAPSASWGGESTKVRAQWGLTAHVAEMGPELPVNQRQSSGGRFLGGRKRSHIASGMGAAEMDGTGSPEFARASASSTSKIEDSPQRMSVSRSAGDYAVNSSDTIAAAQPVLAIHIAVEQCWHPASVRILLDACGKLNTAPLLTQEELERIAVTKLNLALTEAFAAARAALPESKQEQEQRITREKQRTAESDYWNKRIESAGTRLKHRLDAISDNSHGGSAPSDARNLDRHSVRLNRRQLHFNAEQQQRAGGSGSSAGSSRAFNSLAGSSASPTRATRFGYICAAAAASTEIDAAAMASIAAQESEDSTLPSAHATKRVGSMAHIDIDLPSGELTPISAAIAAAPEKRGRGGRRGRSLLAEKRIAKQPLQVLAENATQETTASAEDATPAGAETQVAAAGGAAPHPSEEREKNAAVILLLPHVHTKFCPRTLNVCPFTEKLGVHDPSALIEGETLRGALRLETFSGPCWTRWYRTSTAELRVASDPGGDPLLLVPPHVELAGASTAGASSIAAVVSYDRIAAADGCTEYTLAGRDVGCAIRFACVALPPTARKVALTLACIFSQKCAVAAPPSAIGLIEHVALLAYGEELHSSELGPIAEAQCAVHQLWVEVEDEGNVCAAGSTLVARCDYIGGAMSANSKCWWMRVDAKGHRLKLDEHRVALPVVGGVMALPANNSKEVTSDARNDGSIVLDTYVLTEDDVGCRLKFSCRPQRSSDDAVGEVKTSKPSPRIISFLEPQSDSEQRKSAMITVGRPRPTHTELVAEIRAKQVADAAPERDNGVRVAVDPASDAVSFASFARDSVSPVMLDELDEIDELDTRRNRETNYAGLGPIGEDGNFSEDDEDTGFSGRGGSGWQGNRGMSSGVLPTPAASRANSTVLQRIGASFVNAVKDTVRKTIGGGGGVGREAKGGFGGSNEDDDFTPESNLMLEEMDRDPVTVHAIRHAICGARSGAQDDAHRSFRRFRDENGRVRAQKRLYRRSTFGLAIREGREEWSRRNVNEDLPPLGHEDLADDEDDSADRPYVVGYGGSDVDDDETLYYGGSAAFVNNIDGGVDAAWLQYARQRSLAELCALAHIGNWIDATHSCTEIDSVQRGHEIWANIVDGNVSFRQLFRRSEGMESSNAVLTPLARNLQDAISRTAAAHVATVRVGKLATTYASPRNIGVGAVHPPPSTPGALLETTTEPTEEEDGDEYSGDLESGDVLGRLSSVALAMHRDVSGSGSPTSSRDSFANSTMNRQLEFEATTNGPYLATLADLRIALALAPSMSGDVNIFKWKKQLNRLWNTKSLPSQFKTGRHRVGVEMPFFVAVANPVERLPHPLHFLPHDASVETLAVAEMLFHTTLAAAPGEAVTPFTRERGEGSPSLLSPSPPTAPFAPPSPSVALVTTANAKEERVIMFEPVVTRALSDMIFSFLNQGRPIALGELRARLAAFPREAITPLTPPMHPCGTPSVSGILNDDIVNLHVLPSERGKLYAPVVRAVAKALLGEGINPLISNGGHGASIVGGRGGFDRESATASSKRVSSPWSGAPRPSSTAADDGAPEEAAPALLAPPQQSTADAASFIDGPQRARLDPSRSLLSNAEVHVGAWVRVPPSPSSRGRLGRVISLPAIYTVEIRLPASPAGMDDDAVEKAAAAAPAAPRGELSQARGGEGDARASPGLMDSFCPPAVAWDLQRSDAVTRSEFSSLLVGPLGRAFRARRRQVLGAGLRDGGDLGEELSWPTELFDYGDKNDDKVLTHNELRSVCENLPNKINGKSTAGWLDFLADYRRSAQLEVLENDKLTWTPAECREDEAMELAAVAQRGRYHIHAHMAEAEIAKTAQGSVSTTLVSGLKQVVGKSKFARSLGQTVVEVKRTRERKRRAVARASGASALQLSSSDSDCDDLVPRRSRREVYSARGGEGSVSLKERQKKKKQKKRRNRVHTSGINWSAVYQAMDVGRRGIAQIEHAVGHMCAISFVEGGDETECARAVKSPRGSVPYSLITRIHEKSAIYRRPSAVLSVNDADLPGRETSASAISIRVRESALSTHTAVDSNSDSDGADLGIDSGESVAAAATDDAAPPAAAVVVDRSPSATMKSNRQPVIMHSHSLSDALKRLKNNRGQTFEGGSSARFIISASTREAALRAHAFLSERLHENKILWVGAVQAQFDSPAASHKSNAAGRDAAEVSLKIKLMQRRWMITNTCCALDDEWTCEAMADILHSTGAEVYGASLAVAARTVQVSGPKYALVRIFNADASHTRTHAMPTAMVPIASLSSAFKDVAPLLVAAEVGLSPDHVSVIGVAAAMVSNASKSDVTILAVDKEKNSTKKENAAGLLAPTDVSSSASVSAPASATPQTESSISSLLNQRGLLSIASVLPRGYEERFAAVAKLQSSLLRDIEARVTPSALSKRRQLKRGWRLALFFGVEGAMSRSGRRLGGRSGRGGPAALQIQPSWDTTPLFPFEHERKAYGKTLPAQEADVHQRRLAMVIDSPFYWEIAHSRARKMFKRQQQRNARDSSSAALKSDSTVGIDSSSDDDETFGDKLGRFQDGFLEDEQKRVVQLSNGSYGSSAQDKKRWGETKKGSGEYKPQPPLLNIGGLSKYTLLDGSLVRGKFGAVLRGVSHVNSKGYVNSPGRRGSIVRRGFGGTVHGRVKGRGSQVSDRSTPVVERSHYPGECTGHPEKHHHKLSRISLLIGSFCYSPTSAELSKRVAKKDMEKREQSRHKRVKRGKQQGRHSHGVVNEAAVASVRQKFQKVSQLEPTSAIDGVRAVHLCDFDGDGIIDFQHDAPTASATAVTVTDEAARLLWALVERSAQSDAAACSAIAVIAQSPQLAHVRCRRRWKERVPIAAGALVRLRADAATLHSDAAHAWSTHATENSTARAAAENAAAHELGSPLSRRHQEQQDRLLAGKSLYVGNGSLRTALSACGLLCAPRAVANVAVALRKRQHIAPSAATALSALQLAALNQSGVGVVEQLLAAETVAGGRAGALHHEHEETSEAGSASAVASKTTASNAGDIGMSCSEFIALVALISGRPVGIRAPIVASTKSNGSTGGTTSSGGVGAMPTRSWSRGGSSVNPNEPDLTSAQPLPNATSTQQGTVHPLDPPVKRTAIVVCGEIGSVVRMCGADYAIVELVASKRLVTLPASVLCHALVDMTPLDAAAALRWAPQHVAEILNRAHTSSSLPTNVLDGDAPAKDDDNSSGGMRAPGVALLPPWMLAREDVGCIRAGIEDPAIAALYRHARDLESSGGGTSLVARTPLCGTDALDDELNAPAVARASEDVTAMLLSVAPPRSLSQLLRRDTPVCDGEVADAVTLASSAAPDLEVLLRAECDRCAELLSTAEAELNVWKWEEVKGVLYGRETRWEPYSKDEQAELESHFVAYQHRSEQLEKAMSKRSASSSLEFSDQDDLEASFTLSRTVALVDADLNPLPPTPPFTATDAAASAGSGSAASKASNAYEKEYTIDFEKMMQTSVLNGTARRIVRDPGDVHRAALRRSEHGHAQLALQRWGGRKQRRWIASDAASLVSTDGRRTAGGIASPRQMYRKQALSSSLEKVSNGGAGSIPQLSKLSGSSGSGGGILRIETFSPTLVHSIDGGSHLWESVWEPHVEGWFCFLTPSAMRLHDCRPRIGSAWLRCDGDEEGSISDCDDSSDENVHDSDSFGPDGEDGTSGDKEEQQHLLHRKQSRNAAHRGSVAFTKASGTSRASRQWGKARGLLRLRALRDEARRQSSTAAYPERTKEEERALLAEGAALRRKMGRWHGVNGNGTVVEHAKAADLAPWWRSMNPLHAAAFLNWRAPCLASIAHIATTSADTAASAARCADPTEAALSNGASEGAVHGFPLLSPTTSQEGLGGGVAAAKTLQRPVRAWELSRFARRKPLDAKWDASDEVERLLVPTSVQHAAATQGSTGRRLG